MSDPSQKSVLRTINILLLVLVLIMHMNVSGVKIIPLFLGVFTSIDGILVLLRETLNWAWKFIFNVQMIYMAGTFLILLFVGLPMLIRYGFLKVRSTPLMAVIFTLYIFLALRIFGVLR